MDVNYSDHKGYGASGFIDSPNGNASHRFCLMSDLVNYTIEDLNFERCQTTEEHFNECYSEALKQLHSAVNELIF